MMQIKYINMRNAIAISLEKVKPAQHYSRTEHSRADTQPTKTKQNKKKPGDFCAIESRREQINK